MGYCIKQIDSKFFISAKNFSKVVEAIKNIPDNKMSYSGGRYPWVTDNFRDINDITEIFRAWRYKISFDAKGNICAIEFSGEKFGSCDVLFKAISKFVKKNSFISWCGEDGASWQDCFDGKKYFKKVNPIIFY